MFVFIVKTLFFPSILLHGVREPRPILAMECHARTAPPVHVFLAEERAGLNQWHCQITWPRFPHSFRAECCIEQHQVLGTNNGILVRIYMLFSMYIHTVWLRELDKYLYVYTLHIIYSEEIVTRLTFPNSLKLGAKLCFVKNMTTIHWVSYQMSDPQGTKDFFSVWSLKQAECHSMPYLLCSQVLDSKHPGSSGWNSQESLEPSTSVNPMNQIHQYERYR